MIDRTRSAERVQDAHRGPLPLLFAGSIFVLFAMISVVYVQRAAPAQPPAAPEAVQQHGSTINWNGTVHDIQTSPVWTVPWTLVVDREGRVYLPDNGLPLAERPGGTFTVELVKVSGSDRIAATLHEPFSIAGLAVTSTDPLVETSSTPVTLTVPGCDEYVRRGLAFRQQCPPDATADPVGSDRLPGYAEQLSIADLPVGATGWTVPWALGRNGQGLMVIDGGMVIDAAPGGTASVAVTKAADQGFTVTCVPERVDVARPGGHYIPVLVKPGC
ncbi:hypothetical protein [Mycobacterium avium]|nr:hypothetical protein [Mycobacterium avium]